MNRYHSRAQPTENKLELLSGLLGAVGEGQFRTSTRWSLCGVTA